MIDGGEKRNHQLGFELQNSHVCEKCSNSIYLFIYLFIYLLFLLIYLFSLFRQAKPCMRQAWSARHLCLLPKRLSCTPHPHYACLRSPEKRPCPVG